MQGSEPKVWQHSIQRTVEGPPVGARAVVIAAASRRLAALPSWAAVGVGIGLSVLAGGELTVRDLAVGVAGACRAESESTTGGLVWALDHWTDLVDAVAWWIDVRLSRLAEASG